MAGLTPTSSRTSRRALAWLPIIALTVFIVAPQVAMVAYAMFTSGEFTVSAFTGLIGNNAFYSALTLSFVISLGNRRSLGSGSGTGSCCRAFMGTKIIRFAIHLVHAAASHSRNCTSSRTATDSAHHGQHRTWLPSQCTFGVPAKF